MSEFNWEEYEKKKRELRELDVLISHYLYNKPCVKWWYTHNYDGDETIDNFTEVGEEWALEPLYLDGKGIDRSRDLLDEEYFDGKYHKFDLEVIPRYSSDLNLIHQCEKRLEEVKLQERYLENLFNLIFTDVMDRRLHFDLVHANAEIKAKAIIETLKGIPHEN